MFLLTYSLFNIIDKVQRMPNMNMQNQNAMPGQMPMQMQSQMGGQMPVQMGGGIGVSY